MTVPGPGMIGRDDSMARLRSAVAEARAGTPRAVLVTGEAGIGRTRFVTEASRSLQLEGWLVVQGQAVHLDDGAPPFLPFVQILGEMIAATDPARRASVMGPVREDLVRMLPELWPGPGPAPTPEHRSGDGTLRQARLFEGFMDLGERVAAIQPLCVVVEDVQWLDRSSRDLLRFLVTQARDGRLLLLATARTDTTDDDRDDVAGLLVDLARPATTWIDLDRLDHDDVRRLVAARLGPQVDAATVEAISRRSDGIPLLAIELADAHGRGDGRSRTIEAILTNRFERLPSLAADVVRAAAILAPTIDETRVAVALDRSPPDIESAVRVAVDADILAIATGPTGDGITFRHELLRELAERSLLPAQRRRLHRAIAEAAERRPTETPLSAAQRARHWAAAGEPGRAVRAAVAAQAEAAAVAAHDAVLRDGDLALLLWPHVASADLDGLDRTRVEVLSSEAALCLADPTAAVGYLQAAVDRATGLERAELRGRLRRAWFEAGDAGAAMADAQAALREPPIPGDDLWRAEARLHLAGIALARRAWPEARAMAIDARAILVDESDPSVAVRLALARGIEGLAAVELGEVEPGLALVEAAWADAQLAGPVGFDVAYRRYVGVLRRVGRFERLLEVAEEGRVVAVAAGLARTLGQTLAIDAAEALLELGRWPEAHDRLARLPWSHGAPAPGDRRRRVEALLRLRQHGTIDADAPLDADVLAEAALLRGDPTDALRHLAGLIDAWRRGGIPSDVAPESIAVLVAWAMADGGVAPDGIDLPGTIEKMIPQPIGPFAAVLAAERERTAGAHAPATDGSAWGAAAAALESHGLRWWLGWIRLHEAEVAAARGDDVTTRAGVAAAWTIAADLPSTPLRRAVDLAMRRLGLPLPPARPDPDAAPSSLPETRHGTRLTGREAAVLALLVEGYSNREIAERLAISHKTASVHVSNILAKLEVDNRTQAAAVAVRLGLVASPEHGR